MGFERFADGTWIYTLATSLGTFQGSGATQDEAMADAKEQEKIWRHMRTLEVTVENLRIAE